MVRFRFSLLACLLLFLPLSPAAHAQALNLSHFENLQYGNFGWMTAYVGRPASELAADPRFAVTYKYALDELRIQEAFNGPGTHVLLRDAFNDAIHRKDAAEAVTLRLGRYLLAPSCADTACTRGAVLWVDTMQGLALGVLLHSPTGNLPGKGTSAILFSRQVTNKPIEHTDLPPAFWEDFTAWQFDRKLPLSMTERFGNSWGLLSVLLHPEHACDDLLTTFDDERCQAQALDGAVNDLNAVIADIHTHLSDDSAMLHTLSAEEIGWKTSTDALCSMTENLYDGGTGAPEAWGACELDATQQHVRGLYGDFSMPLLD